MKLRTSLFRNALSMVFGLIMLGTAQFASAQAKPRPVSVAAPKEKKVVLETRFGSYANGSKPALVDFKKNLEKAALFVIDSVSKQQWKVISYQLYWNKREISDNLKTGKSEIIQNLVGTTVHNADKIPAAWIEEMKENLRQNEVVSFERIIVQNNTTKKNQLAPSILLVIQ